MHAFISSSFHRLLLAELAKLLSDEYSGRASLDNTVESQKKLSKWKLFKKSLTNYLQAAGMYFLLNNWKAMLIG